MRAGRAVAGWELPVGWEPVCEGLEPGACKKEARAWVKVRVRVGVGVGVRARVRIRVMVG